MNFVLAAMKVSLKNFLIAGFLGMLPRTILFIWVGKKANDLRQILNDPSSDNQVKILIAVMLVVSIVGLFYVMTSALRKVATTGKTK